MPFVVSTFDPSSATSGTISLQLQPGCQRFVIHNESSINLTISWNAGQSSQYCPAWQATYYEILNNSSQVTWTQDNLLQVFNSPVSQVTVETYRNSEKIVGTYPAPLSRQTATSLTGNTLKTFTATFGTASSTGRNQILNIFNPANSGVNYTFHGIRVETTDTGFPVCFLFLTSGANNNFATPVTPVSHNGTATPAASTAICTGADSSLALPNSTQLDAFNIPNNVIFDYLAFPDSVSLAPGNNLWTIFENPSATAKLYRITMKWSEGQPPAPALVAVGAGQQAVATKLQNDGNAAGTQIGESTVSGDSGAAFLLTNDGQLTLGNASHKGGLTVVGKSSLDNANITSNGSGVLSLVNLLFSGGLLGTAASGDTLDNSGTETHFIQRNGADFVWQSPVGTEVLRATNAGYLKIPGDPQVTNGDTSGTATLYQLLGGAVKLVVVLQANFRQAGAALTVALPVAFTNSCLVWASGVAGFSLLSGGVAQSVKRYTAIGAAGFTTTGGTTVNGDTLNDAPGFDTLQYSGGNGSAHNGVIFIIGV